MIAAGYVKSTRESVFQHETETLPEQGKWVIHQLYAACNREPKKETLEAVQQWLDEVQQ